jgi:fatty-acyl-CoA synthase/long-chain acyl-CoA synthetase
MDRQLRESYWEADKTRAVLDISIGEALATTAHSAPDQMAIIEVVQEAMPSPVGAKTTSRTWKYAELYADARRCASWLLGRFAQGDHICIWAPNVPEWVVLQYGCALAGMTVVTANPALKSSELTFVVQQSRSVALFHLDSFRDVDMGAVAREVVGDTIARYSFQGWLDEIRATTEIELPSVDPRSSAQIQYTSGTTGVPKGALLRHSALVTNASYVAARAGLDSSVLVSPMPLFHTAGSVMSVLGCVTTHSTLVLPLLFEPSTILAAIEKYKGEVLFGVPTMLLALIEKLKSEPHNISSLRTSLSGGAPVSPELHRRVRESFGTPLLTVYGQTELSPIVSQTGLNDPEDKCINTTGLPLWNVEIRIAHPGTFEVLPAEQEGEIQARGYQTMIEYFADPDTTRKTITDDGWLRTGDLGTMDPQGYISVTGRLKDMIIRGGENIYPAEVEACLMRHPAVAEVVVFGAPDQKWGEIVAAAVRLSKGANANTEILIAHCRETIAPHKAPTLWLLCDDFPLTASGKVQKFRLRDALLEGSLQRFN